MKKIFILLISVILTAALVGCTVTGNTKESEIEFLTIDITKDNFTDYIEFITTDAVVNDEGNILVKPYLSIRSKLYDEGWVLFDAEDTDFQIRWNKDNNYWLDGTGTNILGSEYVVDLDGLTTAENMEIIILEGKYTFVKKDYVEQYECRPGYRLVVLVNDDFTGHAQHDDFIGEFYPY